MVNAKYPKGFVWEGKSEKINYDELNVGDAVVIYCGCDDWFEGFVLCLGHTIFHQHEYVKIQGVQFDMNNDSYLQKFKFYSYQIKKIERFAKVVPKK